MVVLTSIPELANSKSCLCLTGPHQVEIAVSSNALITFSRIKSSPIIPIIFDVESFPNPPDAKNADQSSYFSIMSEITLSIDVCDARSSKVKRIKLRKISDNSRVGGEIERYFSKSPPFIW